MNIGQDGNAHDTFGSFKTHFLDLQEDCWEYLDMLHGGLL